MLRRVRSRLVAALCAAAFVWLPLAGCDGKRKRVEPAPVDMSVTETTSSDSAPVEAPGTAMALEEGRMGKVGSDRAEGQYKMRARADAIAAARTAGVLGNGPIGAGTGVVSGFDDMDMHGGLLPGDRFRDHGVNPWIDAATDRLSTFAADVDTASYVVTRRLMRAGGLPPVAAVRVEEFVNYFHYDYPTPSPAGGPFAVAMDAAPSPLAPDRLIFRVGVATRARAAHERPPMHLVFLVDTSGSMQEPDRLPLAQRALRMVVEQMRGGDTIALATYAGDTRLVLPASGIDRQAAILEAIDALSAGGGTAMGSGLATAYTEAAKTLDAGGQTRVIVVSDGDANVGPQEADDLLKIIAAQARRGVTLTTIGVGVGNYRDDTMEQLADRGDGANFYIDGLDQARRVFVEQLGANLELVAQDVKLQVDFDPAVVARYRLVGYENRDLADEDFRDDKVDAGEVGAGHQVTALYELELRPGAAPTTSLATVRIRHKQPRGTEATEASYAFDPAHRAARFDAAPADLRFAFAAAAFADRLRGAEEAAAVSLADVAAIARGAAGADPDRLELVGLIDTAARLQGAAVVAAKGD